MYHQILTHLELDIHPEAKKNPGQFTFVVSVVIFIERPQKNFPLFIRLSLYNQIR